MKATGSKLIAEYLTVGGLFNPEMMEHEKVRDMLMELRADIEELEAIREYLWPNQTGLPNQYRNTLVAIKARDRLHAIRYAKALGWKHCDYPHSAAKDMWHHADHPICSDGKYIDTEEMLEYIEQQAK